MTDLLSHWNLRERPFEATWDTRFFFQSRAYDEALSRLAFLVSEESMLFGLLTGEVGCGKTLTRAVFTERLEAGRFKVVVQENSGFSFTDLLLGVLLKLNDGEVPQGGRTKFARCEQLFAAAEQLHNQQKHLVLVFDEAQEMSARTLNELKMLTNLNGAGRNYLTIILVGQPELREHVAQLPQINQRVSLRFHLNPMDAGTADDYLKHRLRVAGHSDGLIFDPDATVAAFTGSKGVPRQLNRIAKLALEHAWLKGHPNVPPASVNAVLRDLDRHQLLHE